MFNTELAARIRAAVGGAALVALQGSVVDVAAAEAALRGGAADLVEMTRAQNADADLVAKLRAGQPERIRPCLLCNQACQVRDPRNPVVTCIGDPLSGFESNEDPPAGRARRAERADVLVVGGGPAGLEAARVAAGLGHGVTLAERAGRLGGALRAAGSGPGRERMPLLADWLAAECRRLGVRLRTGTEIGAADLAAASGTRVILATGSRAARRFGAAVDPLAVLGDELPELPAGPVVVHDPVGGPVGVAVAERLAAAGRAVTIVTPDPVIGAQLSRTGDLADANARLARVGVRRERHARLRAAGDGTALLADAQAGAERRIGCAVLIDCGHRLPDEELPGAWPAPRAGDCVAPRTVHEAVLEGRRAALACAEPALAP